MSHRTDITREQRLREIDREGARRALAALQKARRRDGDNDSGPTARKKHTAA